MRLALSLLSLALLLRAADPPLEVVRAPDHAPGPVTPGEIVILHAPNLGPPVLTGNQLNSENRVSTSLGGAQVLFDGRPAPLAYSVSGDIMAVVPYEISNQPTTEVVVEYQGQRSPSVTLDVAQSGPALFTLDSTGHGQAAMLNELGCCNSTRNPAKRGSVATLYATGEGQTSPPGITGGVSFYNRIADYPAPRLPVRVTVGGEPSEIVYAGEAPHAVTGLLQVNFRVPAHAPIGDAVPVTLTVGDASSPEVTMAVRSATPRVLVIDPDTATRGWFSKVLTSAGFDVVAASGAKEALDQAHGPVDLAIVSLAIPAPERLETVRALEAGSPQIRTVALGTAAWLSPAMLRAADLLGAQAVFIKPMARETVLRRIRELLTPHPLPD